MKAVATCKVIFLLAQFFVGKFPNRSALLADHEAMATFRGLQVTLDESSAGQHFMSQVQTAKQIEYAVNSNVV